MKVELGKTVGRVFRLPMVVTKIVRDCLHCGCQCQRQPEKAKLLGYTPNGFLLGDWFSGCLKYSQKQPETQPNRASVARRHLASWQINHVLLHKRFGDEPSLLHPVSGCHKVHLKKGSLKVESPFSGCLLLANPSQPFNATAHSPTSSRTEHSFFGNKRALVRRRAQRD